MKEKLKLISPIYVYLFTYKISICSTMQIYYKTYTKTEVRHEFEINIIRHSNILTTHTLALGTIALVMVASHYVDRSDIG